MHYSTLVYEARDRVARITLNPPQTAMTRLFLLLLLSLVAAPAPVMAQESYTLLGAGLRTRPDYDGSSSRTVDAIPVVRHYGRAWFARTTQGILEGGARWSVAQGLDVGAQLAYEQGPLDQDPGASIGLHAEWDGTFGAAPVNALVRLRRHLDADRGTAFDGRVTVGVYGAHGVQVGLFAQATWASAKSFRAYYALPESGLLFTSLGALASYALAPRWQLVGSLEQRRLGDDATRSAAVQRRSAAYASLGLAYRF